MIKQSLWVSLVAISSLVVVGCHSRNGVYESKHTDSMAEVVVNTPQEAVAALEAGNARFMNDSCALPHHDHRRVEATAPVQHPFAAVVGCSDSRVPIEVVFDQGIGDLFVIRTAGNSVNDDVVMGSVDYAVCHLGVKLVVVLGHESCGGITGAITPEEKHSCEEHHEEDGKVGTLLETIREDVKAYVGKPEQLNEAIVANVRAQVARVMEAEHIRERVEKGTLLVKGAFYNVHSGKVELMD